MTYFDGNFITVIKVVEKNDAVFGVVGHILNSKWVYMYKLSMCEWGRLNCTHNSLT